jgi:integrase
MRAIEQYHGQAVTRLALKFVALTFVRSDELRNAEWCEIDFTNKEWKIPGEKMKMKVIHIVPLATQTLLILQELHKHSGNSAYLFPSVRSKMKIMSENTINAALRSLGYSVDQMTCHGFRSMASTLLNESQEWNKDAIERQLAHAERDKVRASYNYAEHLPERRRLMQAWADKLDQLSLAAI